MAEPLYRGYSTVANTGVHTEIHNVELVKQDLLNHFNTRLGERRGRPDFGSIIWDLLFDLSDDRTEALVVQDARRIVDEDPRVELLEINTNINIDAHSITVELKLAYVEFDMDEWFTFTFEEQL